jgi:hypothetical protein
VSTAEQEGQRERGWQLMQQALREMHRDADAIGAKLVVALIPSKEEVYWDVVRGDLPAQNSGDIDRPLGLVHQFCAATGIAVCDLRPRFEQGAKDRKQLYLRVSGHWNDAGNELAAETIAECLRSQGLVPSERR